MASSNESLVAPRVARETRLRCLPKPQTNSPPERESLLNRSRRIMGSDLGITAVPSDKERPVSSDTRRRTQILRAQRTHRQRHQVYLEMLENEVVRLRKYEKSCKMLQDQLSDLCRHLSNQAITLPIVPVERKEITVATSKTACLPSVGSASLDPTTDFLNEYQDQHHTSTSAVQSITSRDPINSLLCNPQVGIDFVLMLEWAYAERKSRSQKGISDSFISAHVLTACLNLWTSAESGCSASGDSLLTIKRLFGCSRYLKLRDEEITPIQIWDIVRRSLPKSGCATAETMSRITAELCNHIDYQRDDALLNRVAVISTLEQYLLLPTDPGTNEDTG